MKPTFGPTEFLKAIADDIEQAIGESNGRGLRPCPFCGSDKLQYGNGKYVWCMNCYADGPSSTNEQSSSSIWNKRTTDDQLRKIISDIREYTSTKVTTIAGTTVISTTTDESK